MDISSKLTSLLQSMPQAMPEVFLMVAFILMILVDLILFRKKTENIDKDFWLWGFSIAIVLFTLFLVLSQNQFIDPSNTYFRVDLSSIYFKLLILMAALILLIHIKLLKYSLATEFYVLLIGQIFGLFLLCIASNFLTIYIAIEIISICSYFFAAINANKKAIEGALKYALFGGICSAIMLYGISLIYGITGTIYIFDPAFARNLSQIDPLPLILVAMLTLSGFLFKIAAFPFHFWVVDVYENTPTAYVSFLSIGPKLAGFLVIGRLILVLPVSIQPFLIIISILSIAIGNFSALNQKNIKRMLGYSTIAQAGFILGTLSILSNIGFQAVYFYLFGYLFSSMLAFYLVDIVEKSTGNPNLLLSDVKGLGLAFPFWGILLIISMVSLVGLPITIGFTSKLFIFSALWEAYQNSQNMLILILLIFGLLNTAVAIYYYLKLPYFSFFKAANEKIDFQFSFLQSLFGLILAFPVLFFFFKPDLIMNWLSIIFS